MSVAGTVNGVAVTLPTKGDVDNAATFTALLQALVAASSTWLQFGAASGLAAAARYLAPGMIAASTTEFLFVAPKAGKLSALYAKATSALSGDSVVITVRVDAADSTLTCTMANGATAASDTTHTVNVTAGQTISVRATGGASYSSGGANLNVSMAFTPS